MKFLLSSIKSSLRALRSHLAKPTSYLGALNAASQSARWFGLSILAIAALTASLAKSDGQSGWCGIILSSSSANIHSRANASCHRAEILMVLDEVEFRKIYREAIANSIVSIDDQDYKILDLDGMASEILVWPVAP